MVKNEAVKPISVDAKNIISGLKDNSQRYMSRYEIYAFLVDSYLPAVRPFAICSPHDYAALINDSEGVTILQADSLAIK